MMLKQFAESIGKPHLNWKLLWIFGFNPERDGGENKIALIIQNFKII